MEKYTISEARVYQAEGKRHISPKKLSSPMDVVMYLREYLKDTDREHLYVINADAKNRPINIHLASMGTLNSTVFSPREIFKSSILSNAAGIIMVHNHPSGDCTPSDEDFSATKRMEMACTLLGIKFLDHVIVAEDYFSFQEKSLLTSKGKLMKIAEEEWL